MKKTNYKTQSVAEMRKHVAGNREALRVIRFGGAGSRSRDVRASRMLRRGTARVLTEIRARDLPGPARPAGGGKAGLAERPQKA